MQARTPFLAISFTFLVSIPPGLCQENPQTKVDRIMTQIYSLPNLPKLTPVKIIIDRIENKGSGHAYYRTHQKRFFGHKTLKIPEIHLSEKYVNGHSDDTVLVTLAHELGHHFDSRPYVYLVPKTPLEGLIRNLDRTEEKQYFANAFALYVLGENLYKKGRSEAALADLRDMGVYWLYVETNPLLNKYYTAHYELWSNYWLDGAKSKLDIIQKLVQAQKSL